MTTAVTYLAIPGCAGSFAGTDGSILGKRGKRLKPDRREIDGRARYTLAKDGGGYRRAYGSRFILEAFVGPCPVGLESCHNDGNCQNDAPSNLRWDTHSSNLMDRRLHGTAPCGGMINTAKLTVADVLEVRRLGHPLRQHAERLNVSEALICAILKRKVWQHV
jgi:hypothetical protein